MSEQKTIQNPANGSSEGSAFNKGIEGVRLQHEKKMANQIAKQNEHNEKIRQAVNRESIPDMDSKTGEAETMSDSLNIDSPVTTTNNNYYTEPTKPTTTGIKKKKALGTLAKLAILAATMGTGAAIPFGVSAIMDYMKPDGKIEAPDDDRTERKYLLDLGK